MRLLDIKRYVNIAYDNFNPKFSNNGNIYYLDNVLEVKQSLQALYDSGILIFSNLEINARNQIVSSITDRLILDSNQYNAYKKEIDQLRMTISVLYSWMNRYVQTEDTDDIINIKLPIIQDISILAKSCSIIDKALTQSVSEFGGEIKFKQLDYGSSWVTISVATSAAAAFVMGLARVAFYVAKKYYGIKLMQKEYERQGMKNDMLKTLKEYNEQIIKEEINKKAKAVEEEYYKDQPSDPERVGRLRNSITELTKLIELGGEIHSSALLEESAENKIDYKLLSSILPQGLLTDGKSEDLQEDNEDK
jgi:hypothetical protein|nr:MAG TPA: hypothetical protein [Caudoviricetes sp.]